MKQKLLHLLIALVLGGAAWLPLVLVSRAIGIADAKLAKTPVGTASLGVGRCESGLCLVKASASPILRVLAPGSEVRLEENDVMISMQRASFVKMTLSHGAEMSLKSVGSVAALKGEHNFTADPVSLTDLDPKTPAEVPMEKAKTPPVETNIFFLGDLRVRLRSPLPNSQILAQSFPKDFLFSFSASLPPHVTSAEQKRLLRWHLVDLKDPQKPRRLASVDLERLKHDDVDHFSTTISIPAPGDYGLVPDGRPLKIEEVRTQFAVKALAGNLRDQIRQSMKSLKQGEADPVFIEQ